MDQIAPNSSGEDVILNQSSPIKKPKQTPCRKNFFFTWNNYKDEEVAPLVARLKEFAFKGKIQSEVGENGTPHLQGSIWCKEKHRDTEFKLTKTIHWETLRDENNIRDYCGKSETHDGKHRYSWGFPPELKLITPTKWWQINILNNLDTEADDRTVNWYWSEKGGVGKSQFAKYCVAKKNCLFFEEGKKADIMHLIFEAPEDRLGAMIIDVPRANGNNISYKAIESIKNGLIYSSKYEGGYKLFNSPHIFVFANKPPKIEDLSEDRWNIINIDEPECDHQP